MKPQGVSPKQAAEAAESRDNYEDRRSSAARRSVFSALALAAIGIALFFGLRHPAVPGTGGNPVGPVEFSTPDECVSAWQHWSGSQSGVVVGYAFYPNRDGYYYCKSKVSGNEHIAEVAGALAVVFAIGVVVNPKRERYFGSGDDSSDHFNDGYDADDFA